MPGDESLRRLPRDPAMRDRFCGCLMGCAVADLLGPSGGAEGRHTRMALLTAEGLLRGWVRFRLKGLGPVFESTVANAYARAQAPGEGFGNDESDAVSRVAPAGMFLSHWVAADPATAAQAFRLGAAISSAASEPERLCAGTYAVLTAWLLRGGELADALRRAKEVLRAEADGEDAVEACAPFAGALAGALSAPDFQSGVLSAAVHGPAAASIAGALLGARFGRGRIPPRWLAPLPRRQMIEAMADDLATAPDWQVGGFRETREGRYYIDRYPPN